MNTRILLTASAVLMAMAGLVLSFLPQEVITFSGSTTSPLAVLLLQCMGALYLGFSFTNWMSRGVIMGGIYARPLAMGNFFHFIVGALALLKQMGNASAAYYFLTSFYVIFAICFGYVVFTHPLKEKTG